MLNRIGFDLDLLEFAVVDRGGTVRRLGPADVCEPDTAGCNWLVAVPGPLCRSCSLTRTRPTDGDPALPAFAEAEAAKRRLVVELVELAPADQRPAPTPSAG